MRTRSRVHVGTSTAVIGVTGRVGARRIRVGVRADLVRRTIQSYVHVETSIHQHYTLQHNVTAIITQAPPPGASQFHLHPPPNTRGVQ